MKSNINVGISPLNGRKGNDDQLNANKQTFKFDKTRKNIYEQGLRDDLDVEELRSIIARANMNCEDVGKGISKMNTILLNAAKRPVLPKKLKMTKE